MLLNTCMNANMQLATTRFIPWQIPWLSANSPTFPGFPDKWSPCT